MAKEHLTYRFGDFVLDVSNRELWQGAERKDLNARYFDALVLLVREHGQLVEKDRFFEEVWEDVVVSDSALTQCIKDIRKQLGDEAGNPRYVQTVPRYGYRFIGDVEVVPTGESASVAGETEDDVLVEPESIADAPATSQEPTMQDALLWASAGALGGAFAGVLGGLLYGSALSYSPMNPGLGTASILIVLLSLNVLVGLVGGAGVSIGMATVSWITRRSLRWSIAGAAVGGLAVGGGMKLLGVDAFNLLFGRAPAGITGGLEGAVLGASLALGARLGAYPDKAARWQPVAGAGIAGALAGALIPMAGGHLMGGSLQLLAHSFDDSRLHLDALGRFFGEVQFGHTTQVALGSIEGMLFGCCVVGAMVMARRALTQRRSGTS